jgi:hypothetical protein
MVNLSELLNFSNSVTIRAVAEASFAINTVSDFRKSFHRDNEKRKRDPFMPALRSKGEKARNRSKRR